MEEALYGSASVRAFADVPLNEGARPECFGQPRCRDAPNQEAPGFVTTKGDVR